MPVASPRPAAAAALIAALGLLPAGAAGARDLIAAERVALSACLMDGAGVAVRLQALAKAGWVAAGPEAADAVGQALAPGALAFRTFTFLGQRREDADRDLLSLNRQASQIALWVARPDPARVFLILPGGAPVLSIEWTRGVLGCQIATDAGAEVVAALLVGPLSVEPRGPARLSQIGENAATATYHLAYPPDLLPGVVLRSQILTPPVRLSD